MAYFEITRHDEPEIVNWKRWHQQSGGVGVRPRRRLTYPYVGLKVYMPVRRDVADKLFPEAIDLGGDHGWGWVQGKAPNSYVKEMRQQKYRVYEILLTIMRDYKKFDASTNLVRLQQFEHRAGLRLTGYSYWDKQKRFLNTEPPPFEVVFDWMSENVLDKWSFDLDVAPDLASCTFGFSFVSRSDAAKFIAAWR